jgi:hypothetical protein
VRHNLEHVENSPGLLFHTLVNGTYSFRRMLLFQRFDFNRAS